MTVDNFIIQSGIGPESTDAEVFVRRFKDEMERGLDKKLSSLAMIPSYVFCSNIELDGKSAVAIDIGGTNMRTAVVSFNAGRAEINQFKSYPSPGTCGKLSWDEYIRVVAEAVKPLLTETDKIGICISFPTTVTPDRDAIIHRFTKEVDVEGFEGHRACSELAMSLGIETGEIKAINDTTAVLLSALPITKNIRGLLGLINGTGTNICCQIDWKEHGIDGNMIIDVESGGFYPPDKNDIDRWLDSATKNPGVYEEEKVVSGAYLGEICRLAFTDAAKHGVFSSQNIVFPNVITTPEMDAFVSNGSFNAFSNGDDVQKGKKIVEAVFRRAAKHIALSLISCAEFSLPPEQNVVVSADGSVFRKSSLFRRALEEYIREYAPKRQIDFVTMEESTLIGTAIGALI